MKNQCRIMWAMTTYNTYKLRFSNTNHATQMGWTPEGKAVPFLLVTHMQLLYIWINQLTCEVKSTNQACIFVVGIELSFFSPIVEKIMKTAIITNVFENTYVGYSSTCLSFDHQHFCKILSIFQTGCKMFCFGKHMLENKLEVNIAL